jgi:hypothetical protein
MTDLPKSGQANEFGGRGRNVFIGREQTYCCTEAPDADAVHKSHEPCGVLRGPEDIQEPRQVLP